MARFEAHLRGVEYNAEFGTLNISPFPVDHPFWTEEIDCAKCGKTSGRAHWQNHPNIWKKATPHDTAEGREWWAGELRLNVFAPGYSLMHMSPMAPVQTEWVVSQAVPLAEGRTYAEAISAAIVAAARNWEAQQ